MQHIRRILVLMLVVVFVTSVVPPAQATTTAAWTITAKGNGHGLGLSQWGASGFANAGWAHQDIFKHYFPNTAVVGGYNGRATVPAMNVQVSSAMGLEWNIASTVGVIAVEHANGVTQIPAGKYKLLFGNGGVSLLEEYRTVASYWFAVPASGVSFYNVADASGFGTVALLEASRSQKWAWVAYEGRLRFTYDTAEDKYYVRNIAYMETYLKGVVPREMPISWPIEAVKAQALAARSYALALGFKGTGLDPLTSPESKSVACTESFQVYNGYGVYDPETHTLVRHSGDAQYADKIAKVVDGTAGQVGVYGGKVIEAYFSSSAGGHTENSENVWSASLPYLRGVNEPYPNMPASFTQTKTFTAAQLTAALNRYWPSQVPSDAILTGFRVSKTGVSGRPIELTVTMSNYGTKVLSGNTPIGNLFRSTNGLDFNSTLVTVTPSQFEYPVTRVWGSTQYDTSVQASKTAFPSAGATPSVIVAGGPIDALTASGLAGVINCGAGGPILMTPSTTLDPGVRDEISRLGANGVYVVGGESVVTEQVVEQLKAIPGMVAVVRLSGDTLFDTAAAVNAEMKRVGDLFAHTKVGTRAIVLNGINGIDAVGAAGLAFANHVPIVPVQTGSVPVGSRATLDLMGTTESLVVGGPFAVSDAVMSALPSARRIAAGTTLNHTAALLAEYLVANEGFSYSRLYAASGQGMVDGISAGPLSGVGRNPLVLVPQASLDADTAAVLSVRRGAVDRLYVLGGTLAVSTNTESAIARLLW